jgi:hypothetical protein
VGRTSIDQCGGSACEIGAFEFASGETPTAVNLPGIFVAGDGYGYLFLVTAVFMSITSVRLIKHKITPLTNAKSLFQNGCHLLRWQPFFVASFLLPITILCHS